MNSRKLFLMIIPVVILGLWACELFEDDLANIGNEVVECPNKTLPLGDAEMTLINLPDVNAGWEYLGNTEDGPAISGLWLSETEVTWELWNEVKDFVENECSGWRFSSGGTCGAGSSPEQTGTQPVCGILCLGCNCLV